MGFQKGNKFGHRFKKGEIGNPYGGPQGFAGRIKVLCGRDYEKIAEGYYLVAFGTSKECVAFFGEPIRRTVKDRLTAISELRDSGPGRPSQAIAHAAPEGREIVVRWQS